MLGTEYVGADGQPISRNIPDFSPPYPNEAKNNNDNAIFKPNGLINDEQSTSTLSESPVPKKKDSRPEFV